MFYKFEVDGVKAIDSSKKGAEHGCIRELIIKSDTKDPHVVERSSSVLLRVSIKFLINSETKEQCREFMKWSLTSDGDNVYRTVKITVSDDKNQVRFFELPNMFCEDYSENLFEDKDENSHGYAELKLIQQAGYFSDVVNEA